MNTLYNANTRSAYQAGYYIGAFNLADILAHGDTGLGALDHNDGELVIDRGIAYRTTADGTTEQLGPDATSPFATVIAFQADKKFSLDLPLSKVDFEAEIARHLPLTNRIWALRIHGSFDQVTAGASERQHPPFRLLADVMTDYRNTSWPDATGTLIAFHCPVYLAGIDYVGGHYHWLSADHRHGGHVTDFTTRNVSIEACEATRYTTQLPASDEFHDLDLSPFH